MIARSGRSALLINATRNALACLLAVSAMYEISPVHAQSTGEALERRGPAASAEGAVAAPRHAADEPLRKAMTEIRTLVAEHHSLVTHRRLPPERGIRFAALVRNLTESIVVSSGVSGASADELVPVIAKLNDGAEAIAGRRAGISQIDGIFLMDEALAMYAERFDHFDRVAPHRPGGGP